MWAAFKSDLKEFASGAAEETSAVASKVGVNVGGDGGGGVSLGNGSGLGGGSQSVSSSEGQQHRAGVVDGSVLLANTAISMGEKGLRGLQGMSSMMGGVVAPRNVGPSSGPVGINPAASSFASNAGGSKPSAALTSMLAAGEEDEEEEELGWDDDVDDDEDLDVDIEEGDVDDGDGVGTEKKEGSVAGAAPADFFEEHLGAEEKQTTSDGEALKALQSKLDMVEKSRAQLQSEHRRQTAELVELRAKVDEMENREVPVPSTSGDGAVEHDEEVRALQNEIEQLKMQLSESSNETDPAVAVLVQEKEVLERELLAQKEKNKGLELRNKALQERAKLASEDEAAFDDEKKQLDSYQQQIIDLTSELHSLQANMDAANTQLEKAEENSSQQVKLHEEATQRQTEHAERLEASLAQVEKSHALALEEAEQSKAKLAALETEIQEKKYEMEAQAANFAIKLQEEVSRAKTRGAAVTSEGDEDCGKKFEETPTEKVNEDAKKEENPTVKLSDDSAEELSDDWGDEW